MRTALDYLEAKWGCNLSKVTMLELPPEFITSLMKLYAREYLAEYVRWRDENYTKEDCGPYWIDSKKDGFYESELIEKFNQLNQ